MSRINWLKVASVMAKGVLPGLAVSSLVFLLAPISTMSILLATTFGVSIPLSFFFGLLFPMKQKALPKSDLEDNPSHLDEEFKQLKE